MKSALALCLVIGAMLPAQTGNPQSASRNPQSEIEYPFELARAAEVGLKMRASALGTSWRKQGAEAAVIRLELDGKYNQHVTLSMGAETHEYRVLLGPVSSGKHRLRAVLDRRLSSPAAKEFQAEFHIEQIEPGSREYEAIRHAPVLYARPDTLGRASDVPLLAYYERLPAPEAGPGGASETMPRPAGANNATRLLQYTYIFSNEDGGTSTSALMARWGRTVDIEYVYRLFLDSTGKVAAETFQGINHKETPFRGRKWGMHPLLAVASNNNNFGSRATSHMRVALWPEPADLTNHSREQLLDRHPWTYRVMAEELEREGKLAEISDPRFFLYLEARIRTTNSAASFGVALPDGRTFRSDRNRADLRIERSGWVRTAIQLPPGTSIQDIDRILFYCDAPSKPPPSGAVTEPSCALEAVNKFFLLEDGYRPGPSGSVKQGLPARIAPGQSVGF